MMRTLLLMLMLSSGVAQAAVTAKVDKNPLLAGEVLTLTISSDSSDDEPELSALEPDFQILGRSRSSQFRMVNGRTSRSYDWIIQLRPRRIGTLTIPSLQVGQDRTQAVQVEVQKPK